MKRSALSFALLPIVFFASSRATADDPIIGPGPWVDRPIVLAPFHVHVDAGLGLAQAVAQDPVTGETTSDLGVGANLEGGVGLPLGFELGGRVGFAFGDSGKSGRADYAGRLFDKELFRYTQTSDSLGNPGTFANPELRVTKSLFNLDVVETAIEARVVPPVAASSNLALMPGIPVRLHLQHIVRVDTGVYFPIEFVRGVAATSMSPAIPSTTSYLVSVPASAWYQTGNAFIGVLTGFRYFKSPDTATTPNRVEIPGGFGGGYTLGNVDIKAEVYALRLNYTSWSNTLSTGVSVGVTLP